MSQPVVSIIIPAWNAERYVKGAVDSALSQTYPNVEIVVVDDGSTDNTRELLQPYADAKKIVYVYKENSGLAGARNTGIRNALGSYIALLDADDLFLPEKVEHQVAFLDGHPECDVSYCDIYHFWDDDPKQLLKLNYRYYSGEEVLPNLIRRHFVAPLTMVLRRSVFDRFGLFDETFRRSEDLEFLVRIAHGGARICFLDEILGKLRLRRTSNLQGFESQPEVKRTGLLVFERLREKLTPDERGKLEIDKYLSRYRLKVGLAYLENGNKRDALPFIEQSFGSFPFGGIFYAVLRALLALVPANLLASLLRRYHIRRQEKALQPL